jgi:hypothetical protein
MEITNKPLHNDRDSSGRFRQTNLCDCCGKPVGTEYVSDDEVCGSSDGPGFFLCQRKRCENSPIRNNPNVEARRTHYTLTRSTS